MANFYFCEGLMITKDFTFQYTDTGIVLNEDVSASFVDVHKVGGLDGGHIRSTIRQLEGMDGGTVDAIFENVRTVVIEGVVYGDESYLDALKANFAPTRNPQPFYFDAPGITPRVIFAKSLGVKYSWETMRRVGKTPIQIQLVAEDPAIYDATAITGSIGLGGVSSGFGFNLAFNFGFGGSTSTSGSANLFNIGSRDADCTFTMIGPVTDPAIVNDSTGNRLDFAGFTLPSGSQLVINLRYKTIRLDGVNRRNALTGNSKWFMIQPGSNVIRFLGSPGAGTPSLSYSFRPAYR
jgi:hypothetical protein